MFSFNIIREFKRQEGDFWEKFSPWIEKIEKYLDENASLENDSEHPYHFCYHEFLVPRYDTIFVKTKTECWRMKLEFIDSVRGFYEKENTNPTMNHHVASIICESWRYMCDEAVEKWLEGNDYV